MHNETPQNTQEAVELGLYLAITADTDEKSEDALELARHLAQELNYAEVQAAKRNVAAFVKQERELRRDLSSALEAVSPSKTPFMTEARDVNLNDWET